MVKLSQINVGDLVVVGLSGYPRWPAFVVDPSWIPENNEIHRTQYIQNINKQNSMSLSNNSRSRRRSSSTSADTAKYRRRSSRLNETDNSVDSLVELSTTIFQDEKKPVMFINDECYMYVSGRQIKYLTKEMCELFIQKYKPLTESNVNPSSWRLPGTLKRYFPQILGAYELAYQYLQNPQISLTEIPAVLSAKLYNKEDGNEISTNDKHNASLQSIEDEDEEEYSINISSTRRGSSRVINDDDDEDDDDNRTNVGSIASETLLHDQEMIPVSSSKNSVLGSSEIEELSHDEILSSSESLSETPNDNTQISSFINNHNAAYMPINIPSIVNTAVSNDFQDHKNLSSFENQQPQKANGLIPNRANVDSKVKSISSNKEPSFKNILSSEDSSYFSKSRSITTQSKKLKILNSHDNNRQIVKKSKYLAPHFDNILNSDISGFPTNKHYPYAFTPSPYSSTHSFSSPEVLHMNSRDSIVDSTNFTNSNVINHIRTAPGTFSANDTMKINNLINNDISTTVSNKYSSTSINNNDSSTTINNKDNSIYIGATNYSAIVQPDNDNSLKSSELSLNLQVGPTKFKQSYRHTKIEHYQQGSPQEQKILKKDIKSPSALEKSKVDNPLSKISNAVSSTTSSDISDSELTIIKKEDDYMADLDLTDYFISQSSGKSYPRPIYRTTFKFYPLRENRKVEARKTIEKIKVLEEDQRKKKELLKTHRENHNEEFYKYQVKLKLAANRLSDDESDEPNNNFLDDDRSSYYKGDDPKKYSEIFDSMSLQRFSRESSTASSPTNLKRKNFEGCLSPVKKIKLNVSKFHADTTDSDGFNYSVMKDHDDYIYYFYYDTPGKFNDNFKDNLIDDPRYSFGPEDVQERVKTLSYEITELLTDKFEPTDSVLSEFNNRLLLIDDLMNLRIERCVAAVDNFKRFYESITPEKAAKRIVATKKSRIASIEELNQKEKQIARQIRQYKFRSAVIQKELRKKQQIKGSMHEMQRGKKISGASTLKELADAFKLDLWIMEDLENIIKELAKFLNITLYGRLTRYCNHTWAKRDEEVKSRFVGCLKRILWDKFRFRGDCLSLLVKRVARLCGHYLNYRTKLMNDNQYGGLDRFDEPGSENVKFETTELYGSNSMQKISQNDMLVQLNYDQLNDNSNETLSSSSFNSDDYRVSSDEERSSTLQPSRRRGRSTAILKTITYATKKKSGRGRPRKSETQKQSVTKKISIKNGKTATRKRKVQETYKKVTAGSWHVKENGPSMADITNVETLNNKTGKIISRDGNSNAKTI